MALYGLVGAVFGLNRVVTVLPAPFPGRSTLYRSDGAVFVLLAVVAGFSLMFSD
jgi:hypothetical protein